MSGLASQLWHVELSKWRLNVAAIPRSMGAAVERRPHALIYFADANPGLKPSSTTACDK